MSEEDLNEKVKQLTEFPSNKEKGIQVVENIIKGIYDITNKQPIHFDILRIWQTVLSKLKEL